ncbi:MAG: hypothetical protein ACF8QF_09090, partial [Phycisphaerales bacterium]
MPAQTTAATTPAPTAVSTGGRPVDEISLALPKGRIAAEVERLLAEAGWAAMRPLGSASEISSTGRPPVLTAVGAGV